MVDITLYWKVFLGLATIVTLLIIYYATTFVIKRYVFNGAQKKKNAKNFLFIWRTIWMVIGLVFALIAFSGSLTALGISVGFLGMVLGWSLQAPVTGMAAWLMIILKRPFKIGDRIIVAGITGDVVDISLTHILLNQVGGTVIGEEKSGRGVLVPNAILFSQVIHNYTIQEKFILDEIVITITFESDLDVADKILISSCREVTKNIVEEIKEEPYIRAEIADSGVRLRLRYKTLAMDRQKISGLISRKIITHFNKNKKVEFCYPHQEIIHRPKKIKKL